MHGQNAKFGKENIPGKALQRKSRRGRGFHAPGPGGRDGAEPAPFRSDRRN
jgi:hypothetical protein